MPSGRRFAVVTHLTDCHFSRIHATVKTLNKMPIKICIVEDDAGIRAGLVRLLGRTQDFKCLGDFASAEAGLEAIPEIKPDVVLMDLNLPGMDGVECVRKLKPLLPKIQIVMLTVYEDPDQIYKALSAGAMGYLLKKTPPAELLEAIRDVHGGGAPMSSQIARKVVQSFQGGATASDIEGLAPREREVLDYLAQGYLIKEIGERLGIGFDTVRTYIRRIYEKLHVHSRAQAVAKVLHASPPKHPAAIERGD
jgi:DNA-binding NarL/FixJ family response regulator